MTTQLRIAGEDFDFDNPVHVAAAARWLAVQSVFGKLTSIHSDWGTARVGRGGGRLVATSDHGYNKLDPLLDLVSPFAQNEDASIILDHAGGGRYVNYDLRLVDTPDWLADAGYGDKISTQILKMEEVKRAAPGAKFDISWNDNGIQFATNTSLRRGLIQFIRRHPEDVIFGTDTVKPVNRSQYLQNLTTLTEFFVELASNDRELGLNLLRRNFERLADRGFSKTMNAETYDSMAAELDGIAASMEAPDGGPMSRLVDRMGTEQAGLAARDLRDYATVLRQKADEIGDGVLPGHEMADLVQNGVHVTGPDGRETPIVVGRDQMRQMGTELFQGIEFEWIANKFLNEDFKQALAELARAENPAEEGTDPGAIEGLETRAMPGGRVRTPNLDDPQTGTGAGSPWTEQTGARWMMAAEFGGHRDGCCRRPYPLCRPGGGYRPRGPVRPRPLPAGVVAPRMGVDLRRRPRRRRERICSPCRQCRPRDRHPRKSAGRIRIVDDAARCRCRPYLS